MLERAINLQKFMKIKLLDLVEPIKVMLSTEMNLLKSHQENQLERVMKPKEEKEELLIQELLKENRKLLRLKN